MKRDQCHLPGRPLQPLLSGRRNVMGLIWLGLMMPLAACGQENKTTKKAVAQGKAGQPARQQEVCRECLQKRAKLRSAFVNKGYQR